MTNIRLDSRIPRTHRIRDVRQLTPMVHSFRIEGTFGARPGQFVMMWVPGVDEFPLSIVGDDGTHVTFAFFAVGSGTEALAAMGDGELVGLRGAYGTHFDVGTAKRVIVLGGGFGSAPMLFAAREAAKAGAELHVLLGAKSADMLLFQGELKALEPASFAVATDDGSEGTQGTAADLLQDALEKDGADLVLACGPEKMLVAVSDLCDTHGVSAQLSAQRAMKCGYGLCGTCVVDPLGIRLCVEGPVLSNTIFRQITEFGVFKRDALGNRQFL